jgi:hypothetical protein
MFGFLPGPWTLLTSLAGLCVVGALGLFEGYHYRALEDDAALASDRAATLVQNEAAARITADSATQAARDQRSIATFTHTQIVEVPRYVTPKSAARCVVPRGFVRLHDSAASGLPAVSLAAGQSDDDATGLGLTAVAGAVTANYGVCRAIRRQLIDLQDWIAAERAGLDQVTHAEP